MIKLLVLTFIFIFVRTGNSIVFRSHYSYILFVQIIIYACCPGGLRVQDYGTLITGRCAVIVLTNSTQASDRHNKNGNRHHRSSTQQRNSFTEAHQRREAITDSPLPTQRKRSARQKRQSPSSSSTQQRN